ncbi:PspA/IM30 family protein [Rufibacter tibetensis]|uniref:Uncharacterized protein n=1 Tax=Rufibacter tibetensis TaxID=512763 RepID=A0A0P0CKB7_9BACT|nr:hypothetical protein [Rufibacter tibetensis]ALI99979.1 hypothetical protein DC20_14605 [Rufibacter tibetensis]
MNILQRIFNLGQARVHPSVEQLNEPIRRTEKEIQELQVELEKSKLALKEAKARLIRSQKGLNRQADPEEQLVAAPSVAQLEQNIESLKTTIKQWEMQVRVLRSRVMVKSTTKTIDQQMSQINPEGSVVLLEHLKEKEAATGHPMASRDFVGNQSQRRAEENKKACTAQNFAQKADVLNKQFNFPSSGLPFGGFKEQP